MAYTCLVDLSITLHVLSVIVATSLCASGRREGVSEDMNNAAPVALRALGSCSRSNGAIWPQPSQVLRKAFHSSGAPSSPARILSRTGLSQFKLSACCVGTPTRQRRPRCRGSPVYHSSFSSSTILRRLKPYAEDGEPGLTFRKEPLTAAELAIVFPDIALRKDNFSGKLLEVRRGDDILVEPDLEDYNRLLRVFHARRVDGAIDVPITDPALLYILETFPDSQEEALKWLRHTYEVDEDDAIMARFYREEAPREQENPSVLTERGQRLGLLKMQDASTQNYYGPQSGAYYAKLSEKGDDDVFGRSALEKIRAENEAKAAEEDRVFQERVDESMRLAEEKAAAARAAKQKKAQNRSTALEKLSAKDVELADPEREVRPPNSFETWVIKHTDRATSDLTLESPEVANMSKARRIGPSLLFVLLGCVACYVYAQTWEAPRRVDRLFPDISLSVATFIGLAAVNTAVFLLWRFPPAWAMLNRYFLVVPAWPYASSMLGNCFSHKEFKHFAFNMLALCLFGPMLHEEIGRGNFLGLYISAGLVGSLFSLSYAALRGILITSSIGASGNIYGIMGAYLWLHKDDNYSFIFIPKEYQESFYTKGWMLIAFLVLYDIRKKMQKVAVDVIAHQAGLLVGIVTAQKWKEAHPNENKPAQAGLFSGYLQDLWNGKSSN